MTNMRRLSSIPDGPPIFDHRTQMRRVDKQYQLLKKRLIIAGTKVRERLLKEMTQMRSSIQFLPAKILMPPEYEHGKPIKEYEYVPLQLPEYVPVGPKKSSVYIATKKESTEYIPVVKQSSIYIPTKKESSLYIPVKKPSSIYIPSRKNSSIYVPQKKESSVQNEEKPKKKKKKRRKIKPSKESIEIEYEQAYEEEQASEEEKRSEEEEYYSESSYYSEETEPESLPEPEPQEPEIILEYGESFIGGLPIEYRPMGDANEYDEVPLIESLSWFDGNNLKETFSQLMQRTYNLNKNISRLRMNAKASTREVADLLIWFLRLNKKEYLAELIITISSSIFYSREFDIVLGISIFMIYVATFLRTRMNDETMYIFTIEPVYH